MQVLRTVSVWYIFTDVKTYSVFDTFGPQLKFSRGSTQSESAARWPSLHPLQFSFYSAKCITSIEFKYENVLCDDNNQ